MVQLSHPYMTTRKTIALTTGTFVGNVMSLLFSMLSRFLTAFIPKRKHFLISWLQSPSAVILEVKKIKSVTISIFCPSIFHEVIGPDAMIFFFGKLNIKPAFSSPLSPSSRWKLEASNFYLTFYKTRQLATWLQVFTSSSLSVIGVVSSEYLRLLLFLLAILIPTCASSSLAFHVMCSAYKLNK